MVIINVVESGGNVELIATVSLNLTGLKSVSPGSAYQFSSGTSVYSATLFAGEKFATR